MTPEIVYEGPLGLVGIVGPGPGPEAPQAATAASRPVITIVVNSRT
jgi:hypothetical protein